MNYVSNVQQYCVLLSYSFLCLSRSVMSDNSVVVVPDFTDDSFANMCCIYVINVSLRAIFFFSGFICGAGCPVGS